MGKKGEDGYRCSVADNLQPEGSGRPVHLGLAAQCSEQQDLDDPRPCMGLVPKVDHDPTDQERGKAAGYAGDERCGVGPWIVHLPGWATALQSGRA